MKKLFVLLIATAALSLASQVVRAEDAKPGDAAAGQKKAAMCIGCHGIPDYKTAFPEVYRVPKISGQNAKYIVSSLAGYKKGDRLHPSMRAIAMSLTDQDMADLAAFYSENGKQAGEAEPAAAPQPSAAVAEVLKKSNCASCHGENFNKPIDASYPKLAGQHPDYLREALREYQTVGNPKLGRNNAIMMGMARPLSHADTKLLAEYISSLPGDVKTVEQSHFKR